MNALPPIQTPPRHPVRRVAHWLIATTCLVASSLQPAAAETATLRETLARGLVAEEVNRDLETARREYEAVLAAFTDQRAVAASALFRLAEIHRAQGRKEEAIAQYQILLRDFPDADREKDLARRQLAAWEVAPPGVETALVATDEEEATLQRLKQLRENSPDVFRNSDKELWVAIENGWDRVLRYFIEQGVDPHNALIAASQLGNLSAVKLVLSGPEKPDAKAAYDAISRAINHGHQEVLRALLAGGLDLDFQPDVDSMPDFENHGTILAYAITQPNGMETVPALIDAGADVNAASRVTGFAPLHIAIGRDGPTEDSIELTKLLLEKSADIDARTTRSSPDYVRGPDRPPEASLSVLDLAMKAGRPDLFELLIERSADAKQEDLLTKACSLPDALPIVRILLKHGADPNLPASDPPVFRAFANLNSRGSLDETLRSHGEQVALIQLLLEHGADPNTTHGTAPHFNFSDAQQGVSWLYGMPPQGEDRELPASLFHQVMLLALNHGIVNLDLIGMLLDVGAVPTKDFPEIFHFVATAGSSIRSRRIGPPTTTTAVGKAKPEDIARKLLAHRPDEIRLNSLSSASTWLPDVRRVFFDEALHTLLADQGGVSLVHFGSGIISHHFLVEPDAPVSDTTRLLFANFERLQGTTLTHLRRAADGSWQRTAVAWQGDAPLPDLQAGDIFETEGDKPEADLLRWALQRRLPAFPITFEIDGTARALTVRPDLLAFDPASDEVPMLHAAALARLLGASLRPDGAPDILDGATFTLHREGWPDLKFPIHDPEHRIFDLQTGDRLVVERGADASRSGTIALAIPGKPFLSLFDPDAQPTLVQIIADAWSPWQDIKPDIRLPQDDEASLAWRAFTLARSDGETHVSVVPRDPDFSQIRIHRVDGDGGETILDVNLEEAIRATTDATPPETARLADVVLQESDIVEIPLRTPQAGQPWRGFDAETQRFFEKALFARYVVIESDGTIGQHEFLYQAPRWIDGPNGLIALSPANGSPTARFSTLAPMKSERVRQRLRGGEVLRHRQNNAEWFVRDGDQVELAAPRPARPTVVPPPSRR